jgi:HAD superfamily hydrolase (TIGR01509 family)
MIKLIIFDLDGVLVEAKNIHYESLNKALGDYSISWAEHLSIYDGLKTNQKLQMLHERKGLPKESFKDIWNDKQKYTLQALKDLKPNNQLRECMDSLIADGYKLAVCSNSIRKTILTVLSKFDIIDCFDLVLSNEDVTNSKPHPEMYWKVMSQMGVLPEDTLIVEDSPYGLLAAARSKANVLRVKSPKEVTYNNLHKHLNRTNMNTMPKWKDEKLNIIIPMAGAGSRFEQAGYTFPKPLIEVNGKTMIQTVVENLNLDGNYIYIVQKSHRQKYNLDSLLNIITPKCKIVEVDGITEGAACTALVAKEFINTDAPLFFANSDQFVEWDSTEFMYKMQETNADGGIVTFKAVHPKWSFAKVNEEGLVTEVAEKNPISDNATVGYYFWKHGYDFVKYAEQMISRNIRVNNEFYVCPVFNQAIEDKKEIRTYTADKMWGLGTPEDLNYFLNNYKYAFNLS